MHYLYHHLKIVPSNFITHFISPCMQVSKHRIWPAVMILHTAGAQRGNRKNNSLLSSCSGFNQSSDHPAKTRLHRAATPVSARCVRTVAVSHLAADPPGYTLYLVSRATTYYQIPSADNPALTKHRRHCRKVCSLLADSWSARSLLQLLEQ